MKININNPQLCSQPLSLGQLFNQYCSNTSKYYSLIVRGSNICLYQKLTNVTKFQPYSQHSARIKGQKNKKQDNHIFTNTLYQINNYNQANKISYNQINKTTNNINHRYHYQNNRFLQKQSVSRRLNFNNNHGYLNFLNKQWNGQLFDNKQVIINQGNNYCQRNNNYLTNKKIQQFFNKKNYQQSHQKPKSNYIPPHKIKTTHKNLSNNIKQHSNIIPNKNSNKLKIFDELQQKQCQTKKIQSQVFNPFNIQIDLSFKNANNFTQNVSGDDKIGQDILQFLKQTKPSQKTFEKQKKKLNGKINISSPSNKVLQNQQHQIEQQLKTKIQNTNSINKVHLLPTNQPQQLRNSIQNVKHPQQQHLPSKNQFSSQKNPYAKEQTNPNTHSTNPKQKNKYTDEQVCQLISNKKKAIIEKSNCKQGKSPNQNLLSTIQRQILDMSDLDLDTLLKIEQDEKKFTSLPKTQSRLEPIYMNKPEVSQPKDKYPLTDRPETHNQQILTCAIYTLRPPKNPHPLPPTTQPLHLSLQKLASSIPPLKKTNQISINIQHPQYQKNHQQALITATNNVSIPIKQ